MLEPSLAFYAAVFGAIKRGAVAVPLFTLFGPEGVRLRVDDCRPVLLITNEEKWETTTGLGWTEGLPGHGGPCGPCQVPGGLQDRYCGVGPCCFSIHIRERTRALPEAVKHSHRAVVVVSECRALRDRCPSRRSVFLSVIAGLGARHVAWHVCAARNGSRNRYVRRKVLAGTHA